MKAPLNLTKLYYSIGEVSSMFDVNPSLLRYWETEFKALTPKKSRKGDRQYTVKDIDLIAVIYTLVKERGFTIEGANSELTNIKAKQKQIQPIIKKLNKVKQGLIKIKKELK